MYTYVYVHVHMRASVRIYLYVYVYGCICHCAVVCVCVWVCMCVYVYVCLCMYVCMYMYMCMCMYICITLCEIFVFSFICFHCIFFNLIYCLALDVLIEQKLNKINPDAYGSLVVFYQCKTSLMVFLGLSWWRHQIEILWKVVPDLWTSINESIWG